MKQLLFLFIAVYLLNGCAINKDIRGAFCSSGDNKYVIKLDSNNTFEIERIIFKMGIRHYYCKGEYSYISRKKITLKCNSTPNLDRKLGGWNPNAHKEYLKVVSSKKVILFQEYYKKVILKPNWCDCISTEYLIERDSIL